MIDKEMKQKMAPKRSRSLISCLATPSGSGSEHAGGGATINENFG